MRLIFVKILVAIIFFGFSAFAGSWQPAEGHIQVPLWPGVVPDAQPIPGIEVICLKQINLLRVNLGTPSRMFRVLLTQSILPKKIKLPLQSSCFPVEDTKSWPLTSKARKFAIG